jgi:mannose/fructose/N-acetylgalactosamine-specific phosphotransferase system component IIB
LSLIPRTEAIAKEVVVDQRNLQLLKVLKELKLIISLQEIPQPSSIKMGQFRSLVLVLDLLIIK